MEVEGYFQFFREEEICGRIKATAQQDRQQAMSFIHHEFVHRIWQFSCDLNFPV